MYWPCQLEKISNYFFGPINVTLFGIYSFDSAVCQPVITGVFLCREYLRRYAWSRQTSQNEAELKIRRLRSPKVLSRLAVCVVSIGLMTVLLIWCLHFDPRGSHYHVSIRITGCDA
ncbi:nicotinamide riboside transporter PnuC [Shigella sonnei]